MNTEQVARFIEHPLEMDASALPVLKELAEKHPYSSVYSLLYISAVARFQSISLDQAIEQNAYRLSDRKRLYHIAVGAQNQQANEADTRETIAIQEQAQEVELHIEPALIVEPEILSEKVVPEIIVEQVVIEEPELENNVLEDIEEQIEIEVDRHNDSRSELNDDLQFDFETTAFSAEQDYFSNPVTGENIELLVEQENEDFEDEIEENEVIVEQEISEEEKEVKEQSLTGPKSFTAWLKTGSSTSIENEGSVSVPNEKQAIIDRFISEAPSISRLKTEFYSPSRKAKESLNEESIPVSETLAKIFAAQGNYPKAIHVYHQLILSIPEKKSLFALQIEELKKKITP